MRISAQVKNTVKLVRHECEKKHVWIAKSDKTICPFCEPQKVKLSDLQPFEQEYQKDFVGPATGHYNAEDLIALENSHKELLMVLENECIEMIAQSSKVRAAVYLGKQIRKKVGLS